MIQNFHYTFQKFGVGNIFIFIFKKIYNFIQQPMHVKNDNKGIYNVRFLYQINAVLWNFPLIKQSWFPQKY